ncbi:MAG: beta-sandwich domain-containing protein, partial [Chitinophagaceae bacterium]
MRKLLFIALFAVCSSLAMSQTTGSITGKVFNKESGETLQGVSVIIKGDAASTITNRDGIFHFSQVKSGKTILLISHVGYQTVEIPVQVVAGETTRADIALTTSHQVADEVVVSASKRHEKITDAPASIQVIGEKELTQFSGSNVGELAAYVQGVEFVRMGVDNVSFNARGLNNAFNGKVFQMIDGRNSMSPLSGSLMMGNNVSVNKEDIER